FYHYADPLFNHPSGPFKDINLDGINDWFDVDLDGLVNNFDLDIDGDGIANVTEANGGKNPSATIYHPATALMIGSVNGAGVPINALQADGTSIFLMKDTDGDGFKDFMDID